MTYAPPGYHVVKEHVRKNPTKRRRPAAAGAALSVGGGLGLAAGAVVLVLMASGMLDGGSGNAAKKPGQPNAAPAADANGVPAGAAPQQQGASAAAAPTNPTTAAAADTSTTAYARQYRMLVRSGPTQTADIVATLTYNVPVTVLCHTTGPSAYSFNGASTRVWDKIRTQDGTTGYVSDGWILTAAAVDQIAPAC